MGTDAELLGDMSPVEQTMLAPLWGRATYAQKYPEILDDPRSAEILETLKGRDPRLKQFFERDFDKGEYFGIVFVVRARRFDDAARAYLEQYPEATCVNLGAGLDTSYSRLDNGRLRWYDLDLPDMIDYRRQLIPETDRSTCIAADAFDDGWLDQVEFSADKGIFIIAGGLFMYFDEEKIAQFMGTLARRFPGGRIVFDSGSKLAIRIGNARAKKAGSAAVWKFGMGNPEKTIAAWGDSLDLVWWTTFYKDIPRDPRWERKTRKIMRLSDALKLGKIVLLQFTSETG